LRVVDRNLLQIYRKTTTRTLYVQDTSISPTRYIKTNTQEQLHSHQRNVIIPHPSSSITHPIVVVWYCVGFGVWIFLFLIIDATQFVRIKLILAVQEPIGAGQYGRYNIIGHTQRDGVSVLPCFGRGNSSSFHESRPR